MSQCGDRPGARLLFEELWATVGPDGDPFHRCAIAHSMADVQDELGEEVRWDVFALQAAEQLTEARAQEGGLAGPVRVLYPSLHLNLADDYLRLDEYEAAEHHVLAGEEALSSLPKDGYRSMIFGGLQRIQNAIIEHRSSPR